VAVTPTDHGDDPESADAAPIATHDAATDTAAPPRLDVTPRTPAPGRTRSGGRGRAVWAIAGLAIVIGALALVLFNGLRDASTFFYNVDEAVAKQTELQGKRFRMQGNVVDGTVKKTKDGVTFVITYAGKRVPVDHTGDPPELFGPKIPVVLEGTFVGDRFESDQILIRHDNTYDEKNPDRIKQADRDAQKSSASGDGGGAPAGGTTGGSTG
jgi:cytochrome c-type biogenesis protein CcmE